MISNNSNISPGWCGWLRWLVNTSIALIAAGSGVVAMLDYFGLNVFVTAPTPTPVLVLSATSVHSDPSPAQTSLPPTPTFIYYTATSAIPIPTEFVLSYWQNVSGGRYENAWTQLSPEFRRDNHNNDYNDYVRGYQQKNLCGIEVKDVNLLRQDSYSAVVTAHSTYHTGPQCNSNEYNFEMWLIYDSASNLWLFDKNMFR